MPSLNTGNAILSNAIAVDSSYNVGIGGAASGSFKLQVTGASNFIGVLTATDGTQGLNIRAYTGGAGFGAIYSTGVTAGAGNFALAASATQTILSGVDSVNLAINSAIKFSIASSGNVGINTTSPSTRFELAGSSGNFQIASSGAEVFFTRDGNNDILANAGTSAGIRFGGQQQLRFATGSSLTTRLTIDSTGAATFSSTSGIGVTIQADWDRSATNNNQLYIRGNSNTNKQLRLGYDTTGNVGYIQALTSGTSVDNLLLNPSGGNVGIGNSNPLAKLSVVAPACIVDIESSTATQYNGLELKNGGGSFYVGQDTSTGSFYGGGAYSGNLYLSGSYPMVFWTGATERMRITSGGQLYFSRNSGGTDVINIEAYTGFTGRGILLNMDAGSDAITIGGSGSQNAINVTNSSKKVIISNLGGSGTVTVQADNSGTLIKSSDSSLKQEDKEYKIQGLAEILQLQPRAYKWLKDIEIRKEKAVTEIGFFADEVNPIIPSAAPKGFDGLYGFNDRAVTAALVKAIQELNQTVQNQQQQINSLINR